MSASAQQSFTEILTATGQARSRNGNSADSGGRESGAYQIEALMPAPESYLLLTVVGIAGVAVFALLLGMTLARNAKPRADAILAQGLRHHVRFRYRSAKGTSATLRAIIYEVEQRHGRLYFRGLCLPGRAPRTFRSDRVENLVDLENGEVAENIDVWLRGLAGHA